MKNFIHGPDNVARSWIGKLTSELRRLICSSGYQADVRFTRQITNETYLGFWFNLCSRHDSDVK